MSDRIMALQMMLLANKKEIGVQCKTNKEAKILFPEIVKELQDYVNSEDYLMLMVKEMQEQIKLTNHATNRKQSK